MLVKNKVFNTDIDIKEVAITDIIKLDYQLIEGKGYTIISDDEFDKIFKYNKQRIDKFGLFNTYLAIKKFSNANTKESYPSIEYLMYICNIGSNNTILKYINILIELELIKCIRGEYYIDSYGDVQKSNNIYTILN